MFRKTNNLLFIFLILIYLLYSPKAIHALDCQKERIGAKKIFKNVLNINFAAAVVLGVSFQRLHIPLNYERVIHPDMSIVIGCHPAAPLNSRSSEKAFGASLRVRQYRGLKAPRGFWREWGIWGIYQHQNSFYENRTSVSKAYGKSMAGVLFDFGYKYVLSKNNLMIEPFIGIAFPVVTFSKEKSRLLGLPFPWAGLSLGVCF